MTDDPSDPPPSRRTVRYVAPDDTPPAPIGGTVGEGSTRSPLAPGLLFAGRYTILAQLGRGGMGDVYRARDERLQRDVALKRLHAGATVGNEPDGAARLLREARAAAAIDHPAIVAVFDAGEADGAPYIVMELVAGETLRAHLTRGTLDAPARLRVLLDVARALSAAHARGIVHRDVKPENVLVKADGAAKVLDFGIARAARPSPASADGSRAALDGPSLATLTADGLVMGTAGYMAPEQLRGEPPDARSDQFAWGVVAYEALTGSRPWSDGGAPPTVSDVLTRVPAPLPADVPGGVGAAVVRALAIAPAARFESMEIVVELVARAIDVPHVTPSPEPPSPSIAAEPRPRRDRGAAWVAAVAVAAALAGAAALVAGRVGAPRAESVRQADAGDRDAVTSSAIHPQARAEYEAAMQAFRDGAVESARASFEKAAELDQAFGAAHLRAVLTNPSVDPDVRLHAQRALELRAGLDDRDRVLLDAFMPWLAIPKDPPEAERRLTAAAARAPEDAELAYHLCRMRLMTGEYARAIPACDQALRADPSLVPALRMKGLNQISLGDAEGAERTYVACLEASPAATACLADHLEIQMAEGKCGDAVRTSRRIVALAPGEARSYQRLAEALLGAGEPLEGVRAALARRLDLTPEDERAETEINWLVALAMYAGDFTEAERQLLAWQRMLAGSSEEKAQVAPLFGRWSVAFETGDKARAAALASDFLRRRAGWTPHDYMDVGLYAFDVRYQAGVLPRLDFVRARDAWLVAEKRRPAGTGQIGTPASLHWLIAYAVPASTREDAEEALAALPAYLPLPGPVMRTPEYDDALGMVYLRAGRAGDALSALSRASRSCSAFDYPMEQVAAFSHLGRALEATGDREGACRAYGSVVARWGHATPRSVSAREARARRATLHCAP